MLLAARSAEDKALITEIEGHGLQNKFDTQLVAMAKSHSEKSSRLEASRDEMFYFPQNYEINHYRNMIEDGVRHTLALSTSRAMGEDHYNNLAAKYTKIHRIANDLIPGEQQLRLDNKVDRTPVGTTYYGDSDNGSDITNDGLGTGTTWATLDKFAENARSAGDIYIMRGGRTATYEAGGTSVNTASDGTLASRIIVSMDYGDAWGDHVNTSGTATVTVAHGSKTVTASADISGVLAAGDMIYINGDDNLRFSYEVESVVTTTITLFLPYKGDQTGSGLSLINMQSQPIWDDAAGASIRIIHTGDFGWWWRGLKIQSGHATKATGVFDLEAGSYGIILTDMSFVSSTGGSTEYGVYTGSELSYVNLVKKCRFFNFRRGMFFDAAGSCSHETTLIKDCLVDGNSVTTSQGIQFGNSTGATIKDCEGKNNAFRDVQAGGYSSVVKVHNTLFGATTDIFIGSGPGQSFISADHDQVDNSFISYAGSDALVMTESTSTVRTGGSPVSIHVWPSADVDGSAYDETTGLVIFEYTLRHDTDPFTVDVYMRPDNTGDWTADPTADQLFLEVSYRLHATNKSMYDHRSTGVIDMNGSTAWQKLTVAATPGQVGNALVRLYYGKTKEAGSNEFHVDPRPVIYKT